MPGLSQMMSLKHLKENYFNWENTIYRHLPLGLAVLIYLLFRTKAHIFLKSVHLDTFSYFVKDIQSSFMCYKKLFPSWFIYSLPDGLWTYSITCSYVRLSFCDINIFKRRIFFVLGPILSISIEIAQYFKIFPGTFDMVDIYFIFIAIVIAYFSIFIHMSLSVHKENTIRCEKKGG